MGRYQRIIKPGDLVHVVSRFANRERRITSEHERGEYLRRLGRAIEKSDWRLISFCIMNSHLHWASIAGWRPFSWIARRVHPGFAQWLNRRQRRLGAVFADRPKTPIIEIAQSPRLVAYIHNNPVKAGVCDRAVDSQWSSHRFYTGQESPPSWLSVSLGMRLSGFEPNTAGRQAFNELVESCVDEPREFHFSGKEMNMDRIAARRAIGQGIDLGYPLLGAEGPALYPVLTAEGVPVQPVWDGNLGSVVKEVADQTGLALGQILSRNRKRQLCRARRLVVLVARDNLGRGLSEVAATLGMAPSSALALARNASKEDRLLAGRIASFFCLRAASPRARNPSSTNRENSPLPPRSWSPRT